MSVDADSNTQVRDRLIREGISEEAIADFCRRLMTSTGNQEPGFKPTERDWEILRKLYGLDE